MHEAVDEGDDARGVGEHLVPFSEGLVGGEHDRAALIATRDDLEEQVGIAVVVGQVSHLIDTQEVRAGEASQAPGQRRIGVLGGEFVEHVGGVDEACGMAAKHGLMGEVLGQHGLAQAVGSDEHDVGRLIEEGEGEQLLDEGAVDIGGPVPVEVGERFEGANLGIVEAPFEATPGALVLFDVDELLQPGLSEGGVVLGEQAMLSPTLDCISPPRVARIGSPVSAMGR